MYARMGRTVRGAAAAFLLVAAPEVAEAAGAEGGSRFGPILFGLAVLVVAAKAGGLGAQRLGQPPVLGELLVGIGLSNFLPLAGPETTLVVCHRQGLVPATPSKQARAPGQVYVLFMGKKTFVKILPVYFNVFQHLAPV